MASAVRQKKHGSTFITISGYVTQQPPLDAALPHEPHYARHLCGQQCRSATADHQGARGGRAQEAVLLLERCSLPRRERSKSSSRLRRCGMQLPRAPPPGAERPSARQHCGAACRAARSHRERPHCHRKPAHAESCTVRPQTKCREDPHPRLLWEAVSIGTQPNVTTAGAATRGGPARVAACSIHLKPTPVLSASAMKLASAMRRYRSGRQSCRAELRRHAHSGSCRGAGCETQAHTTGPDREQNQRASTQHRCADCGYLRIGVGQATRVAVTVTIQTTPRNCEVFHEVGRACPTLVSARSCGPAPPCGRSRHHLPGWAGWEMPVSCRRQRRMPARLLPDRCCAPAFKNQIPPNSMFSRQWRGAGWRRLELHDPAQRTHGLTRRVRCTARRACLLATLPG